MDGAPSAWAPHAQRGCGRRATRDGAPQAPCAGTTGEDRALRSARVCAARLSGSGCETQPVSRRRFRGRGRSEQLRGGELGADLEDLRVRLGIDERRQRRIDDPRRRHGEAVARGAPVARAFAACGGAPAGGRAPGGDHRVALPVVGRAGQRAALLERGHEMQVALDVLGLECRRVVCAKPCVADERAQVAERRVQLGVCIVQRHAQGANARRGGPLRVNQRRARTGGCGGREHPDLTPSGQVCSAVADRRRERRDARAHPPWAGAHGSCSMGAPALWRAPG